MTATEQGNFPATWAATTLGELVMPSTERVDPSTAATTPYVGLEHIGKATGKIVSHGLGSEVASTKSSFSANDILYGKLRPYLNKVAVPSFSGICSTDILCLKPTPIFLAKFGLFRLLHHDFVNYASSNVNGVQHPRVDWKTISEFEVMLPPLAEQTRIVAKLEELFSKLDAGVAGLKRTQALLKRYRQSLLHAAVTGELTRAWREQQGESLGHAADLLADILAERRRRWQESGKKGQYKEPAALDVTGLPELPQGWVWASIDQLSAHLTSGSRDWSPYYNRGDSIFIMAQNIRMGALELSFKQFVDPPLNDISRRRTKVLKGDILCTVVGAGTGDVCKVDIELEDHYICQSAALIRPVQLQMTPWIEYFLISSEDGQRQIGREIYGQGRPHLSFEDLKGLCIAVPHMEEQAQIVAEVERRLSILDNMEATVAAELKRAASTRQSILVRAFSGRLVPQNPTDEPANVLLERMQAEKLKAGAAAIRGKGGRGRKAATAAQPALLSETAED